ncbi:MAG TPA: nucleotide exchange factor GrpE [Planctomycetaceae bacterium]|nr:nucleotide exchange factor GrpE [Planctomycetaceae bacterium]|tara:strand:+ start:1592 stop:2236 length:645 start_codon:yes stop_codon:yes gene_type:complete
MNEPKPSPLEDSLPEDPEAEVNSPSPIEDPAESAAATDSAANEVADTESEAGDEQPLDLQGQLQEANDRVLRIQAELENSRKRMRREMDEQRRFAVFPLLSDLLPVVDNLGRAVQSANENPDAESLLAGVEMVATQLSAILEQHKCQKISAAGEPFDPNLHEAIGQQPSSECPEGHVAHVALEGYSLHDRVIRPSQVLVSTGTPEELSEGPHAE